MRMMSSMNHAGHGPIEPAPPSATIVLISVVELLLKS